ncbi:MAG: hypothetical protein QOJ13_1126 [Gaiellales bacterium]|nr:hypothetical protein [Gaiellales bacterium]
MASVQSRAANKRVRRSVLVGRTAERDVLDALLADVRGGTSRTLVVRGGIGVGKTALLSYLVDSAVGLDVAEVSGVDFEMGFPHAGLHQLLTPMLGEIGNLPNVQADALTVALGMTAGPSPDPFLVGLATLNLLADAALGTPLLCVVDDAHWVDGVSIETLVFAARRLEHQPVGIVFAERDDAGARKGTLPELRVEPLGDVDARSLLSSIAGSGLESRAEARIVLEALGNPLALVEFAGGLTRPQLTGTVALPHTLPVSERLRATFLRGVDELSEQTQTLLLLAAAEPSGDAPLLSRAASRLGIEEAAVSAAEAEGLLRYGPPVTFRHPLIRSAVYGAATIADRQRVHRALADASVQKEDADRRAWHRAAATLRPHEGVAAQLERSADRARTRGGHSAAAALLARAAELTPSQAPRVDRMIAAAEAELAAGSTDRAVALLAGAEPLTVDEIQHAKALRLRAAITFAMGDNSRTVQLLAHAAYAFEPFDPRLARDTYLEAMEAAIYGGSLGSPGAILAVARAAEGVSHTPEVEAAAADDLLEGLAAMFTDRYEDAVPVLRRALEGVHAGTDLRWFGLSTHAATDLWDEDWAHALATRRVVLARETGAMTVLVNGLGSLGGYEILVGRFDAAEACFSESREIAEATGNLGIMGEGDPLALTIAAWRGRDVETRRRAASCIRDATARGVGCIAGWARGALGTLEIGLGNYAAGLTAIQAASEDAWMRRRLLPDLVEAAARVGDRRLAAAAAAELAAVTLPAGTPWALGIAARSQALVAKGSQQEELYQQAIHYLDRSRVTPQLARARLLYGEWLRRGRRRRDARRQLGAAHEIFSSMGAGAFARRASRELQATGGAAETRPAAVDTEALTAQETRIARLAGEGLSNAEIGAQLFVSRRTVEYHLHKVYRKLEVASRTRLAVLLRPPK